MAAGLPDTGRSGADEAGAPGATAAVNPFVAYRQHLDLYRRARERGLDDDAYIELVTTADAKVADVAGTGFRVTPLVALDLDGSGPAGLGPVVAKVETGNVAGSHKARHLFGLLLHLLLADGPERPLAIASCGNAALGAAVVAASAGRALQVFVPADADPVVVARLDSLGADVVSCHRQPGQDGDPCVHRLHQALAAGAEPFTVQGPLAPAVIDGARTLGLELAAQLDGRHLTPTDLFIQIGGGALATAVMDGLHRAWPDRPLPRLRPVQARAAHPYVAGWRRIAGDLLAGLGSADPGDDPGRAQALRDLLERGRISLPTDLEARAGLMTPWPSVPRSVATGILDDLTYDWVTLMAHQVASGGWPELPSEATLTQAADLAAAVVTPPPDATGAAGLAGLLEAVATGTLAPRGPGEVAVVILSGVDRRWSPTVPAT